MIFFLAVVSIYFGSIDAFKNGSCNIIRFIEYINDILAQIFQGLDVPFKTIFWSLVYKCHLWEDSHLKV